MGYAINSEMWWAAPIFELENISAISRTST